MRQSIRKFDASPLLLNGYLTIVCSRGVWGCVLCLGGVGHLNWTFESFQRNTRVLSCNMGMHKKRVYFSEKRTIEKRLQESRSRQSALMAFSDLEERKHKHFPEKQYAGARANIAQKSYGASSKGPFFKVA